jgi:hypothetical protein
VGEIRRFGGQERGDLVLRERQLGPSDLEHLSASAEPVDAERQLAPRREDEVQGCRGLEAKPLEQVHRVESAVQLVHVIDDEHEVTPQPLGEGLADQARRSLNAPEHIRVGARAAGGVRRRQLVGKVRQAQTQRPE